MEGITKLPEKVSAFVYWTAQPADVVFNLRWCNCPLILPTRSWFALAEFSLIRFQHDSHWLADPVELDLHLTVGWDTAGNA